MLPEFMILPNTLLGRISNLLSGSDLKTIKVADNSVLINNLSSNPFNSSSVLLSNAKSSNFFKFFSTNYLKFKYDYKNGNYLPEHVVNLSPFMTLSKINNSNNKRFNSWFFSDSFIELIGSGSATNYTPSANTKTYESDTFNHLNNNIFDFFFKNLTNDNINTQFISINSLNQKYNKLFLSSSIQQRLYNNWRELKFSREAWRTKLLISRHQKTLYNRYASENNVFWTIERNAKDLLPGWAMITPFSSRIRYTAIGKTDIGLFGVFLTLNASIISSSNFLLTYRYLSTLNNRKMRDARSFFSEAIMVTSLMMIAANPMLILAILMLLSDRHLKTSFFDYSGGGDTVLFQHMFWFFGHPEVYVVLIPVFGFINTILSSFLKKRISARTSLTYSLYTIAFLGFFVWGHHMYMVGLAHTTRMLFSTLTVMISVPAATKLMHWSVTLVNSSFHLELPLVFALIFIFLFISGGISGMCVAHTGMDVLFHDTLYVIGHFHIMFSGAAMFGSFAAFYFYFPAIFGIKYSRIYAYFHLVYYLIGHLMTFIPLLWLGYAGMPRRVLDYPSVFGGWHSVASAGHILALAGVISFFIMIFDSMRQSKNYIKNSYGIGRYNTRLNFYIYETHRLNYLQDKSWSFLRIKKNPLNFENYETTLLSYSFIK
jgi:cytochrome c oxidase subunit 1